MQNTSKRLPLVFQNATVIDTSKLAAKSDLVSLKAEIDQVDIDKLVPASVDLSKLSDVVKTMLLKKRLW